MAEKYLSIPLFEQYKINCKKYSDISVTVLPLSARIINRLLRSNVTTLEKFLMLSPEELLSLNGFGKNCFYEVESFCKRICDTELSSTTISEKLLTTESSLVKSNCENIKNMSSLSKIDIFKKHKEDIAFGNFSSFNNYNLTEKENSILVKYKEGYELLGEDIVFECISSPQKIMSIINAFSNFITKTYGHTELYNLLLKLPKNRKNNKSLYYIRAFTLNEKERSILEGLCADNDCSLESLDVNYEHSNDSVFKLLRNFIKWCNFDLDKELADMFSELYTNERMSAVIKMRAKKMTLEQVGNELGITRERVRQIEAKIKRKFAMMNSRIRIISKIVAERDGDTILTPLEIEEHCHCNINELLFLLQNLESSNYIYDRRLDVFIVGDDSIRGCTQIAIENLPDIMKVSQLEVTLNNLTDEAGIPYEILEKAFFDAYHITGDVYHRYRLSLATIYENVLKTHYPTGFKAYDPDEIKKFRTIIKNEYGDVGLPENDRALTSRVASICVLCGRGIYRFKQKDFLPKHLANKICNYIEESENTIFLTNTLFDIFEDELLAIGIDNKYFLQGVLHDLFADKFVFRRDYISKDIGVTSVYSAVVDYIKKSDFPVTKAQIKEAFPGITEIVINFSIGDSNVLNYFGEYLHASKLRISDDEKNYLLKVISTLISDGEAHHGREMYDIISNEKTEILTRNAAMFPFSAYSIVEYLFRDRFQFSRPYIAQNGVDIGRPAERLHDLIYSSDEFTVNEISEFAKENRFQINSLLDYISSCNDEFLLVNDSTMMRINRTGIDSSIALQVEDVISETISETTPITNLSNLPNLPTINIPWTEWLIYSVILKWGTKLEVGTSSNQFKLAIPLIAPVDKFDSSLYKNEVKDTSFAFYVADDLSNLDLLLEDIVDESFLSSS